MSYTLIERKELTETASSISFDNIPQFYTDVVLLISARSNASGLRDLYMSLNGSTASFTGRNLDGTGSAAASVTVARYVGTVNGTPQTANTFGNISVYIPNYAGSTNKSFSVDGVTETNGTTAIQTIGAGLWSSTAPITSVAFAPSTDSLVAGSSISLYGINRQQAIGRSPQAVGGIIAQANGYWYHVFNGSGTFRPFNNLQVDYLVVAGGGGGGCQGGGGGAGGLRSTVSATGGGGLLESSLNLTPADYAVTVGAGGASSSVGTSRGGNGSNSVFSTITSIGGGGGGSRGSGVEPGASGGSGGGAGVIGGSTSPGSGTTNQGFAGGFNFGSANFGGGGGGGGGAVGSNGTSSSGGSGGSGVIVSITGASVAYAGGGGAGLYQAAGVAGSGGIGGGGAGTVGGGTATSGIPNTGGGGGGSGSTDFGATTSGAGGSGIVIIRYKA
jgi:hypothetical protein